MADKQCPECGLWNTETAFRCDCGYDFAVGDLKVSYLNKEELQRISVEQSNKVAMVILLLEAVIGGIAGLAGAFTRVQFFPYWGFGLALHYICMPIAGIVGVISGVLIHYPLQKVNDGQIPVYVRLILVFIIGFLAGFLPFGYLGF